MMEAVSIVADLSRKYTSGESTSVTYETANQLMGAVMYCIEEYKKHGIALERQKSISLREKYEVGKELLLQKIQDSRERYNHLMEYFNAYGNHNYQDTVTKAISGFFVHYDARFNPQNTIITCDYPTIISVRDSYMSGIDLIDQYLHYIELEQKFLRKIPRDYICRILYQSDSDYENQFYNIAAVIVRHLLVNGLIGKPNLINGNETDYKRVYEIVGDMDIKQLRKRLDDTLSILLHEAYDNSQELHQYFQNEITELSVRLKNVESSEYLKNVIG